jgi:hypothetical protein
MDNDMNAGKFSGMNQTCVSPVRKRRRIRVPRQVAQLSDGSESDISDYEIKEDEDVNVEDSGRDGMKHRYREETWSQGFLTNDPKPMDFLGRRSTSQFFRLVPTILQLFDLFWPFTILRKIVIETNRYATMVMDALGNTRGGPKWESLTVSGLKAFLAIHMYMGMKKQPNYKSYWEKEGSLFHCPIISNIMSRARFTQLQRCLHITNPTVYEHI